MLSDVSCPFRLVLTKQKQTNIKRPMTGAAESAPLKVFAKDIQLDKEWFFFSIVFQSFYLYLRKKKSALIMDAAGSICYVWSLEVLPGIYVK